MFKKNCPHCEIEFETKLSFKKFCTKKCAVRYRYLANKERYHAIWRKYYRNNREKIIKKSREYQKKNQDKWKKINNKATRKYKDKTRYDGKRNAVLERFNHQCKNCSSSENLHIHHIDNQGWWNGKPNNEDENLELLCCSCHNKLHWQTTRLKRKSDTLRNKREQ